METAAERATKGAGPCLVSPGSPSFCWSFQAAEPRRDAESLRSGSSAHIAWDVLARVWSFLTSAQSDNGCRLDPNGRCRD